MAELHTLICDVCSVAKASDKKNWLALNLGDGIATPFVSAWPCPDKIEDARSAQYHVCGVQHAQELVGKLLSKSAEGDKDASR